MLEQKKLMTLFSRNIDAKKIAKNVWNPQNGAIPRNIPNAIDNAFTLLLSLLPKISSLMKVRIFFFFLFNKKLIGLI